MNKIRRSLATIALVVMTVLSGLSLQVFGSAPIANAASSHASSVTAPYTSGQPTNPIELPNWPCGGGNDC